MKSIVKPCSCGLNYWDYTFTYQFNLLFPKALKDAKSSAGKVASEAKDAASSIADNVKTSVTDKKDE